MTPRRIAPPLAWAFLQTPACGGPADEKPAPQALVVSPSDGAVVHDAAIPLSVHVPTDWRDATWAITVDQQPVDTSVMVFRARWSRGGGADVLGMLDLWDLPPGEHLLEATFTGEDGVQGTASSRFTWEPHPCRVSIAVEDPAGVPRAGRVLVLDSAGKPVNLWGPDAAAADPADRDDVVNTVFAPEGRARVLLAPGAYRFVATAGLRDSVDQREVTLDGDARLRFELRREVETPGWLAADLHVHTVRSADAFIPDEARFGALASSGVEVAVVSDHNIVRDARPALELLELDDQLAVVPGTEARVGRPDSTKQLTSVHDRNSIGHMNAFPLVDGEPLPPNEPQSIVALIDSWRERQQRAPYPGVGDTVVLQLNHPRGIQFFPKEKFRDVHALWAQLDYDPTLPLDQQSNAWFRTEPSAAGTTPFSFDAVEVVNRFSLKGYRDVRQDWFSLMNQGLFPTGTGNSDSHAVHTEMVGIPVNLVQAPPPTPEVPLDMAAFVDAVRGGRLMVTSGPILWLEVDNDRGETGRPGDLLDGGGGRVTVRVRLQAASWVPVNEIRLVVDGRVVALEKVDGAPPKQGLEWAWEIGIGDDAWVIAEAGWPLDRPRTRMGGPYPDIAPGYVPMAFTNAVRIDRDGDGRWARHFPAVTLTREPAAPAPR